MRIAILILTACLSLAAVAQDATPPPKKNPFEGFGTSLDKRPGGQSSTNPFGQGGGTMLDKRGPAPAPAPSTTPSKASGTNSGAGGIVLSSNWSAPLPESSGGHSSEIQDLKALLGPYGTPSDSLAAAPGVIIYPGIRYLMPQAEAARLLGAAGITTKSKIACGGFPDGLSYTAYDGRWEGVFNRLYIVTDLANQVVSLEFVAESSRIPHTPPWQRITATRHVLDYVNATVKGQRGSPETWMYNTGYGLVIDTVSHQTVRWYVPKPLIDLILFCAEKSGVK